MKQKDDTGRLKPEKSLWKKEGTHRRTNCCAVGLI